MKYLKLYESFQQGKEFFAIMDKDRNYYISNVNAGSGYSRTITLNSEKYFDVNNKDYKAYNNIEDAQKVLDVFKNKPDTSGDNRFDSELVNYCVRIDPWVPNKSGGKYWTEHDVYSHYTKEEIVKYVEDGNIDKPNYPESHQRSNDAERWANYYFPCYNMDWDNDHVKKENAKGNIIKDINKYDEIVGSLEVVKLFIGAYEMDDLNI